MYSHEVILFILNIVQKSGNVRTSAKLLGVGKSSVYRWLKDGAPKGIRRKRSRSPLIVDLVKTIVQENPTWRDRRKG